MIRNTFIFFGVAAFIAGCIIGLINIFSNNEIPGAIGVIVIGSLIAFALIGSTFQKDDILVLNSIKAKLRNDLIKEKKEQPDGVTTISGPFFNSEIESGFSVSKMIALKTQKAIANKQSLSSICKILIDDNHRQVIFQKGATYTKPYNFSDIIKYEIYENNKNVVEGKTGAAIIGGLFFGEIGAIVGASGEKKVNGCVSVLKLIVYINDINCAQIEYSYLDSDVLKSSEDYSIMINNLQEISGYMEYIMNNVLNNEANEEIIPASPKKETSKKRATTRVKRNA